VVWPDILMGAGLDVGGGLMMATAPEWLIGR